MKPAYDASEGVDGRVSIEVDPRISHDTDRTVAEAKALWWLVDRPNLYIKIPATQEGLAAITQTLAAGISVNVTLIFSLERYDAVMEAFLAGVEQAKDERPRPVRRSARSRRSSSPASTARSTSASATAPTTSRAWRRSPTRGSPTSTTRRVFSSDRWKALEAAGARPQRPLWASTGVKDPKYDDTQYVVELVAPGTVNTMPEATLEAVFDHGTVRGDTVTAAYDDAQGVLDRLKAAGVDYDDVVQVLEDEGLEKFEQAWGQLIDSVTEQLEKAGADVMPAGATTPAGDGPAAASPDQSAR